FSGAGGHGLRSANDVDRLDAGTCVRQTEAMAGEDLPVADGVQVREPVGELHLFAVDGNIPVRRAFALDAFRQIVGVDGQEPAHSRPLVLQKTGSLGITAVVHDVRLQLAEHEVQHVVEVHANVRRDTVRFAWVPFPAFQVPLAAG